MARPKKGTLYNLVFPMVDSGDFASIESGITASDFNSAATKKFFGVNHGSSTAATSGTISKATLLVHSGIFQQTLNTTETNYDRVIAVFRHPSCADQILVIDFDDYDDSDIMSRLSDIGSDLLSYLTGISGMVSDVDSQLLLNASMISDIQSALDSQFAYISNALSDIQSDLTSQIGAIAVTITASDISDIASAVKVILASDMSDILSAAQQGNSRALVVQSMVSDVDSQLTVTHSLLSDVQSAVALVATSNYLSQIHSDLTSQIGGLTVNVTASDMSDIASRVWATVEGTRVDSRILVLQSLVSDVDSAVNLLATSNYLSQIHSDLTSQIGGITVTVTASDMSDIASRVWATTEGARVDSRILVIQSLVSDVDSQVNLLATSNYLSQVHSDLTSQIGAITVTVTASDISDIASAVKVILASDISDILSAAQQTNSRVLVTQSLVSDVQSALDSQFAYVSNALSDLQSDLTSQIGGLTVNVTASDMSDIASRVWATVEGARVDSRILVIQSLVSDVDSQVNLLATSNYLSQVHSDLTSQIGAITVTVTASDISDIASAVKVILASDMSDILSAAQQTNSRALVIQSMVSDVDSALTLHDTTINAAVSDAHSDLASQIAGITATVSASDISDIASAVQAILASNISDILSAAVQTNSRALVIQSLVSDVQSALDSQFAYVSNAFSDLQSDLTSQIGGLTVTVTASDMSDIASRVWAEAIGARVDSRIALIQSNVSDVESAVDLLATSNYLSQVHSDLLSYLAGISGAVSDVDSQLLVTHSLLSDVESAVDVVITGAPATKYDGPRGPGIYFDSNVANTNTTLGTDGTVGNPVSSLAAAVTLTGSLGAKRIYVVNGSTIALTGQTLSGYNFVGIGPVASNIANLGTAASPSILTTCSFNHLHVYGQHDFSDRIELVDCAIDDAPAAEITKLRCWAHGCALLGDFSLDTSDDNIFDLCLSGVAGDGYPVCNATGLAGTVVFRHYSGGIGLESLSASHKVSIETDGQVVFESGCNVNAAVSLRGMMTIVDNTAGMNNLTKVATAQNLNDFISDVDSQLLVTASVASDTYSLVSDLLSDFQSRVPKAVATNSQLSDLNSNILSYLTGMSAALSDVESAVDLLATSNYLSQVHSDLTSQIGALDFAVTASDISDIASAVQATLASNISDILSAAQQTNSRALVIQSMVSDVDSALTLHDTNMSNAVSSMQSDLTSQIGGIAVTVSASDISDIASAVLVALTSDLSDIYSAATQINSRVALVQSNVSDIESQVDLLPTSNYLSQIHSDLTSQIGGVTATVSASSISDIASAVWANTTRTLTQAAASVTAAVSGSSITVYRGTTWSISLTGLGDISTYDTIYLSAKASLNDSEDNAYLRVKNAASGLLRINQAAPTAATNGTITIDNAVSGNITITINEAETTGLPIVSGLTYDIKGVDNDGQVDLISIGSKAFTIAGDVTRAIT